MEDQEIGWFCAILVGGLAGWIAEKVMKSDHSLFTNIVLGVVGATIANVIFTKMNIAIDGWIGYLITGLIGACLLIAATRIFKRKF
jgi:uncharacterized membrane protein YeaQ/YmgE (transglycosylase-associated protein family)